jgi:hypothetical protein
MSNEIHSKEDVTPETVVALAAGQGIVIATDRIDVIGQRLKELFDLAAPLEGAALDDYEVTQPFDARWTEEASA